MNAMNTINQVFMKLVLYKTENPKPVFYSVHPQYSVHPIQVLSSASRGSAGLENFLVWIMDQAGSVLLRFFSHENLKTQITPKPVIY